MAGVGRAVHRPRHREDRASLLGGVFRRDETPQQVLRLALDALDVSILARPEGRAPRRTAGRCHCDPVEFQSSPDPKAGRHARDRQRPASLQHGFNPRPTRRPGATPRTCDSLLDVAHVSILARPEGRAPRMTASTVPATRRCFNPRPTRRPGATAMTVMAVIAARRVSILARPEGRAPLRRDCNRRRRLKPFQSSPDPKAGRHHGRCLAS